MSYIPATTGIYYDISTNKNVLRPSRIGTLLSQLPPSNIKNLLLIGPSGGADIELWNDVNATNTTPIYVKIPTYGDATKYSGVVGAVGTGIFFNSADAQTLYVGRQADINFGIWNGDPTANSTVTFTKQVKIAQNGATQFGATAIGAPDGISVVQISGLTSTSSISSTGTVDVSGMFGGATANKISGGMTIAKNALFGQGIGLSVTSTVTVSGGTTTLTIFSGCVQVFTGTNNYAVNLPAANIFGTNEGQLFIIKNRSSGILTINRAGSDTIDGGTSTTVAAGSILRLISNGGTDWLIC